MLPAMQLTTVVNPTGSGVINAPAQNCAGGYRAGTVVQLNACARGTGYRLLELEWGCEWDEQPGDGDDGWEQECHRQLQCGGHGSREPHLGQ